MKNLDKILDEINQIELKVDVNSITYNEIFLWPIIRSYIARKELEGNISTKKDNIFYRLLVLILDSLSLFNFKKIFKKNIFLLYGYDPSGKYVLNKNTIHKQANPIKDYVDKKDFYFLEFGLRNYKTPKINGVVNISLLFLFYKTLFYPLIFFRKIVRKRFLKNHLDELINNNILDFKIWHDIDDFFLKKYFFELLIKIIKPKKIFLKSFSNTTAFSLVFAANLNSIPTIDYQHGQQGNNNTSYSKWLSIPKTGYLMLPRYFWLWDSKFENKFYPWIANQTYHETKIVGNLWFNFVKNNKDLFPPCEILSKNKINVLVCLQKTHLPEIIRQCLIHDNKIIWHFRLHPRELHNRDKLNFLLNDLSFNYNLDIANDFHLESLIQSVDVVITEWSTVAYEATLFKKKTIVIHPNGYNAFHDLILNNRIYYTEDFKKLLEIVYN